MRTREFIFEYDRAREQQRIQTAYDKRIDQDPEFTWERLEQLDPTPQQKYVPRLAQWWLNGSDILDLADDLDPALYYYFQLGIKKKLRPEHRDLNKFSSPDDFLEAMDQYDLEKIFQTDLDKRGAEKQLIRTPEIRVVQILDEDNMRFWAKGTKWCTGGDSEYDFGQNYTTGSLYVIIPGPALKKKLHKPTDPKYPEVKFQYWWTNSRFEIANELDQPPSPADLDVLRPYLIPIFGKKHKNILWDLDPNDKLISTALLGTYGSEYIHFIKNLSDEKLIPVIAKAPHLARYLKNPTKEILLALVEKSPRVLAFIPNPDQELLIKVAQKDRSFLSWYPTSNEQVLQAIVKVYPEQIAWIKNPSDDVQQIAVSKNSGVLRYIKNPSPAARQIAAGRKSK